MTQTDIKTLWPDFQNWETRDLCALYEAALAMDDTALARSNMPSYSTENAEYPGGYGYNRAGETVVAWSTFYSDIRDAIAAELRKRPVTDWTFMTLVEHVNRLGDDPAEVVNVAAGLLARQNAIPQAAE